MGAGNGKGAWQGSPVQHFPQRHSNRTRVEAAHQVLLDTLIAAGLDDFVEMAIKAAAESYARECVRAEFASFMAELDATREVAA